MRREVTYVAAQDFVLFGVLYDLLDVLNNTVNFPAQTTDKDGIFRGFLASILSELDEDLLSTDDSEISRTLGKIPVDTTLEKNAYESKVALP